MSTLAETRGQIGAVREAAQDPRGAYLIRSRLRRTLLACARLVAERQGVEKPTLPGQWSLAPGCPENETAIVATCRRIYKRSEYLCQPSESFDVRWESGWNDLQRDLLVLESQLEALSP